MMALRDRGKPEMNQFVCQLPVIVEVGKRGMLTHRDPASRPGFTKAHSIRNALMLGKKDPDPGMCHGEPAEVRRGSSRGSHHPIHQGGSVEIELVRIEGNVDLGPANFKAHR
jgi:hypothetical protein